MALKIRGLNQAIEQASAKNDPVADRVEIQRQDGTVVLSIENDGTLKFVGGLWMVTLDTAITANVTTTTAPAGSFGLTSHATGRGKLFVSDAAKWQFAAIT